MSETRLKSHCLNQIDRLNAKLGHTDSDKLCMNLLSIVERYIEKPHASSNDLQHDLRTLLDPQTTLQHSPALEHTLYQKVSDHSNDHIAILDTDSRFLNINWSYTKTIGYQDPEDAIGLSYQDFKAEAVSKAPIFRNQDVMVLQTKQPLEFLSYHQYANGNWHLLHGEKTCVFDNHQTPIGIFSRAKDVTHSGLIDITRFLLDDQQTHFGRLSQKSFTYYITNLYDHYSLTSKEKEVLFYFIRGKTAQDIANILCRSKRTIDVHLESIKIKFEVDSKAHLIEKAIIEGYMTMIPHHMLGGMA